MLAAFPLTLSVSSLISHPLVWAEVPDSLMGNFTIHVEKQTHHLLTTSERRKAHLL